VQTVPEVFAAQPVVPLPENDALHDTQVLLVRWQSGVFPTGHCECCPPTHCTHSGPAVPMMQRDWFWFMHPAPGPLSPTLHRTQPPVVPHTLCPVQSAARHARQVRDVGSQIGVAPVQSAATFGRQVPQTLFWGIAGSGMKQRWLLGQPPLASQRTQRPVVALQMLRCGLCRIVASEHQVLPPEIGTKLQPRQVPVLVSHQGAAEFVSQSLSLRHCTQRPLVMLHTCPVGHVPFMQPWHW
jgi:hypothetical protein